MTTRTQLPLLTTLSLSILLLFPITIFLSSAIPATALGGGGGKVGGRTKITDVETNMEVQDLGRYSVQEYNRQQREKGESNGVGQLKFKKVVAAEKQTVAGIKYFLTVEAVTGGGHVERFEAEVVVQSWKRTKELLHFAPHPPVTK